MADHRPQGLLSGGGQSGGQARQVQMLTVRGIDPGSMFSGETVRDLAEKLLAYQKDGGCVVLA